MWAQQQAVQMWVQQGLALGEAAGSQQSGVEHLDDQHLQHFGSQQQLQLGAINSQQPAATTTVGSFHKYEGSTKAVLLAVQLPKLFKQLRLCTLRVTVN